MFKRITPGSWLERGTGEVKVLIKSLTGENEHPHDLSEAGASVRDVLANALRAVRPDLLRRHESGHFETSWNKKERVLQAEFL